MVMQIVTIGGGKHVLVDWLSSFDSGHHFCSVGAYRRHRHRQRHRRAKQEKSHSHLAHSIASRSRCIGKHAAKANEACKRSDPWCSTV